MKTVLGWLLFTAAAFAAPPLVEGNASSPVRVLIYEDLQCSDCAAFRQMLDKELLPKYGAKVAFEHRDFPLAKHACARKAAIAGLYFLDSGAPVAVEFRRHMLQNIQATTPETLNRRIAAFAKQKGLDPGKAVAAIDNPDYAAAVGKDFQDGVAARRLEDADRVRERRTLRRDVHRRGDLESH